MVASLMSPVASLVTTDRCSNVSMCLRISTKCFIFPGIAPLLYSVGNKTYYYYYYYATSRVTMCQYVDYIQHGDISHVLLFLSEHAYRVEHHICICFRMFYVGIITPPMICSQDSKWLIQIASTIDTVLYHFCAEFTKYWVLLKVTDNFLPHKDKSPVSNQWLDSCLEQN